MPYPYVSWAQEGYGDEAEARAAFDELWFAEPQPVNLSMRSTWVRDDDHEDARARSGSGGETGT